MQYKLITELNNYNMNLEESDVERYIDMLSKEYPNDEIKVFVECIMSKNIRAEDMFRCLTAMAVNMKLDWEFYEVSETDEEGELQQYATSDFQLFIDESISYLMYENDFIGWLKFYKKQLLKVENYELLHILKLEQTWNI